MRQNLLPYSKSKKQGSSPGGLAFNSLQAKSLCEMLVQRGISVHHKDVAWHSS
jgi:hypothetical protein